MRCDPRGCKAECVLRHIERAFDFQTVSMSMHRLLALATMVGCAVGIVCPPELLQGAPVGLGEGSTCGGTCNTHGSCAAGLVCKEASSSPFLGVRPSGICSSATDRVDLDSEDVQSVVKEAVQLLNGQLNLCGSLFADFCLSSIT